MSTTWTVLAEAAWLLRRHSIEATVRLLQLLQDGVVDCPPFDANAPLWMVNYFQKYADLKPQLADVCLCYLAEQEGIDTIFTLDRRDFTVYRNHENQPFELLPSV